MIIIDSIIGHDCLLYIEKRINKPSWFRNQTAQKGQSEDLCIEFFVKITMQFKVHWSKDTTEYVIIEII